MVHSELYSTILAAFDEAGWEYAEIGDREVIRAGFEAHHARVELHVQAFEKLPAVSVVAESSRQTADPVKRERLVEAAMRVNETLTVGNFELMWDVGRLLFRATNLFTTPQGDPSIIQGLVHNTVGEMDRIAPIEALIHESNGPELAGLNIPGLLKRDDLLPDVPVADRNET
ncbi:MAG: hypothetical protein WD342_10475 [Verrucomicrobiales bacterium]